MKQVFNLSMFMRWLVALIFGVTVAASATAQNPDSFVTQITSSVDTNVQTFASDVSGNGRFVVIESTGNIATQNLNNADGNREIFLYDYVQRRIFQITNTISARRDGTRPFTEASNIAVEISNNRPMISNDNRFIVFNSNAITPAAFIGDGFRAALDADGNQEIFIYEIPLVAEDNLSSGQAGAFVDLSLGTFTQLTNTPASRRPQAAVAATSTTAALPAFVAFDNRDVAVNNDASLVAFVSTRNITGANADANPEIFVFNRLSGQTVQITNTTGAFDFNENPSLSGSGAVLAFISNANIAAAGSANSDGNSEVYLANLDSVSGQATAFRQVTRTQTSSTTAAGSGANVLSPGRRLSQDGNLLAFESRAELAGNSATLQTARALFVYNIAANSFTQVGPRATSSDDLFRFPVFTDNSSTLVFASALNFRDTGEVPASAGDGLNPSNTPQIFSTPVNSLRSFARLTNTPTSTGQSAGDPLRVQPLASNSVRRLAFSIARTELGGGNADGTFEAFYLNVLPPASSDTSADLAVVSLATGASRREGTPLAPGMLAVVQSTGNTVFASASSIADIESETLRPALPTELNNVSVSIGGAAAGLRSVSNREIQFVVPIGLAPTTGTYPVVVNTNGAVIRGSVQITPAQPDILLRSGGNAAANRALVSNLTGGDSPDGSFGVTSVTESGETVPTVLFIGVTGVRGVQRNQISVRIGSVDITGEAAILGVESTDIPGYFGLRVQLPDSLAGAGDVPVIVNVTISGQTYASRPEESAPRVRIN